MKYCLILFSLMVVTGLQAQVKDQPAEGPPSSQAEYEARYQERIRMTEINGVHIPADLDEALRELTRLSPPEAVSFFREQPEDEVVDKLFAKLGQWMVINWGFYDGSRLSAWLRDKGITFPDDMARVIMHSWHRSLNGRPVDLDTQILGIQDRIRTEQEARKTKARVMEEFRRPGHPGDHKD